MKKIEVISVNISEKKGTVKNPVEKIILNEKGVSGDAHAGDWNRQVSLLGTESITKFERETGKKIGYGEFAENITTLGFELHKSNPLDRFVCSDVILEVTQIGKECHGTSCNIFRETGNCIMPSEGIFCRVIKPGVLKPGDTMQYLSHEYYVYILTVSDRASAGIYKDKSGPAASERITAFFTGKNLTCRVQNDITPDNPELIRKKINTALNEGADIILTTGGTGIGSRDFTPDVVKSIIEKEIPGIMDYIRFKYGTEKPGAFLSRSIAGTKDRALIYALPGSANAVKEYLSEIEKTLMHSIYMIHGLDLH